MKLHRIVYTLFAIYLFMQAQVWNGKLASYVLARTHSRAWVALSLLVVFAAEIALASWAMVTIAARERQEQAREKVRWKGPRG